MRSCFLASQANGAQPGARIDGARQHLPKSQFSLAVGAQSIDESRFLGQGVKQPNRTEGQPLAQLKRILRGVFECFQIVFVFEGLLDGLDFGVGTFGKIGDGAVLDFAGLAIGLREKNAAVGIAVDGGFSGGRYT